MKLLGLRLSLLLATFLIGTVAKTAVANKLPWANGGKGVERGHDLNKDQCDYVRDYLMPLMI